MVRINRKKMNRLKILILVFICLSGVQTRSVAQIQKEQTDLKNRLT